MADAPRDGITVSIACSTRSEEDEEQTERKEVSRWEVRMQAMLNMLPNKSNLFKFMLINYSAETERRNFGFSRFILSRRWKIHSYSHSGNNWWNLSFKLSGDARYLLRISLSLFLPLIISNTKNKSIASTKDQIISFRPRLNKRLIETNHSPSWSKLLKATG